jgi:hypothetical protein
LHSPTHALLLASKSNYRNLLEGNHVLGISYPDSLSTGLTSKRTSHKVAKQGRRNRINDALKEMRALIPASSGARAEKLMTKGGGGDDDSQETKEKDSPRRKLRGSVNDLEIAVEDTRGHEQTILAGNSRPESFGANFRDTDTEASGSHAWGTSSAGEAAIVERENVSEARMSLQCDGREASPPDEPRSTQIEIASKDEPPNSIHDDVDVAAFPASKSSWSLEHDANLAGNSQLSKNVAKFLVSTKDLEPILFASFLGMSIHDLSERPLNIPWDVVLGVVSILLAAIAYLAYIHLDLKSCGESGGAMEGHGEKETPMADRSDLRDSLYNSEAYNTFSVEPFDFVHASYEKRILSAVGGDLEQSGVRLGEDVIHHIAREISWVPVHYLDFSDDTSLSYADATKAFIETYMGESWNWWPLAPRLYQLRQGYCRLQWMSVCGSSSFFSGDLTRLTTLTSHVEPFATSTFQRLSRKMYNKLSELRRRSSTLASPLANMHTRRVGMAAVKRALAVPPRPCHSLAQGLLQQARCLLDRPHSLSKSANRHRLQARAPIQQQRMCSLSTSISTCRFASCLPLATLSACGVTSLDLIWSSLQR